MVGQRSRIHVSRRPGSLCSRNGLGYNGLYLIIYGGWCFVGGSVMRWHEQIEDEWREEQQRKWQDEQQRKGRKP